jgi:tetratricopeptide (TPR) repeat protein
MGRARARAGIAVAFVSALLSGFARSAEQILFLKNGRQIVADRYWHEGEQILYERNGSTFGFPRSLLERVVEPSSDTGAEAEPESGFRNAVAAEAVEAARQSARDGEFERAVHYYRRALDTEPSSLEIRLELGALLLEQKRFVAAEVQLEQARRAAPEDARVRELLGDVYYAQGRIAYAVREWQAALATRTSPGLLEKLRQALRENDEDIQFDVEEPSRTRFFIRYDGRVDERAGRLVAEALEEEHAELRRELRFTPQKPVAVTLHTAKDFSEAGQVPEWASGLNDGEIRIPLEHVTEMTPKLRRLLRHELTHSFVNAMTAGNCPSWLHEGYAQLREGNDRPDGGARLRAALSEGKLLPLWKLEGPLLGYSKEEAVLAYAQALSATEYLARRRGRSAVLRVFRLLGEGRTMNEALKRVVGLDYEEFQTVWEADLDRNLSRRP